jgi:hypothetical protein
MAMPLTARGTVTLGSVQFTTDPGIYEPFNWKKRMSKHPGLQGAMTIQDFGRFAKDLTIRLGSGGQNGSQQYLEQAAVVALDGYYAAKGVTYTLTDWLGNEFTVFIEEFRPVPTFLGSLFTYEMSLHVLGIAKLFNSTYGGS